MDIPTVNYDMNAQWLLSAVLASMVLGVALNITLRDFKQVLSMPKAIVAGLSAQFLILPATTFAVTMVVDLPAGMELGMILVSSCPGGAVSNFVTQLAKGNVALSISLTACASLLAIFMLPFNFLFWSSLNPDTAKMLTSVDVDEVSLVVTLVLVLAIPLFIGLFIRKQYERFAAVLHSILNKTSSIALAVFIIIAVLNNYQAFLSAFSVVFVIVLGHNLLAYCLGYIAGKAAKLSERDVIATTIEVGMQNSSLAIAIVFTQFAANVEMALICAFWGTWHLVSGILVASVSKYNYGKKPA